VPSVDINLAFAEALDVRLVPYRRQAPAAGGDGSRLMQLLPSANPQTRRRFVDLFQAIATSANPNAWLAGGHLYDSGGAAFAGAESFVGAYLLAWDDVVHADDATLATTATSLPTVLFWIIPPANTASVALTLVHTVGPAVVANAKGNDPTRPEPLGPRWEWLNSTPETLGDIAFNSLILSAASMNAAAIEKLVVALGLAQDDVFEFAQSAAKVEGILTIRYPSSTTKTDDPVEKYRQASANYNKLDVASSLSPSPAVAPGAVAALQGAAVPLNFWSEALAVYTSNGAGWHDCTFHYRYRQALYADDSVKDPANPQEEARQARELFSKSFAQLGSYRRVLYDLKHVSGDDFPFGSDTGSDGGRMVHDQPPSIAADLRRLKSDETVNPTVPFLTWSPPDQGSQSVGITVNTDFLAPVAARSGVTTQAWWAIAEMVYGNAALRGRFRRFDFLTAARDAASTPEQSFSMNAGLVAVGRYEDDQAVWPLPASAIATFRSWLNGTPPAPYTFHVDLGTIPGLNLPPLGSSCHVVELHLDIARDPNTLPGATSWDLRRPTTNIPMSQLFDAGGQKTEPAPDASEGFQRYLATLGHAWGTIAPAPNRREAVPGLTGLLSGPEYNRDPQDSQFATGNAGGEWTSIGTNVATRDRMVASLLPLAFLPLDDLYKGVATAAGLLRYAETLAALFDAAPGKWRQKNTAPADWGRDDWRAWFRTLSDSQSKILTVLLAFQKIIVPAYGSDPDSQVASLIAAAQQSGQGAAAGLGARLRKLLLSDPSQFSRARALLLTRLAADAAAALPSDFLRLDMTRLPKPLPASPAPPGPLPPLPQVSESVRLSLGAALLAGITSQQVAFLETLGNQKYDSSFTVSDLAAHGLEQIAAAGSTADPQPLPMAGGPHLPGGGPEVHLPSREPIAPPLQVYSLSAPAFEGSWWQRYDIGAQGLSRTGLLKNNQVADAATNDDALFMRARTNMPAAPRTYADMGTIVSIYLVTSDENNSFDNDNFPVSVDLPYVPDVLSAVPMGAGPITILFKALDSGVDIASIDSLATAISPEILDFAAGAMSPSPQDKPEAPQVISIKRDGVGGIEIVPALPGLEAFLFQPRSAPHGPTVHVLVVTYNCEVWQSHRVGLGQTRNIPELSSQPAFDSRLWRAVPLKGAEKSVTARSWSAPPSMAAVPRQNCTMQTFVTMGLVAPQVIHDPSHWQQECELTITIFGRLVTKMDSLYPDAGGGGEVQAEARDHNHGRIPLHQIRASRGSFPSGFIQWEPGYGAYSADFVWTDMNNNEVLRFADLPIQFTN
jgi:hypothetical protein